MIWSVLGRTLVVLGNIKETELMWVDKHSRSPLTHLAIVTYTEDRVLVLVTNHTETVHRVLVTVLSQTTFLDRLRAILTLDSGYTRDRLFLGTDIPL